MAALGRVGKDQHPPQRLDWRFAAACFAILIASFFVVDSLLYRDVVYILAPLFGSAVLLVGIRRFHPDPALPWLLLLGAEMTFAIGNGIYLYYFHVAGVLPYPSTADLFFILHVALAGSAMGRIVSRREADEPAHLIEATIVGIVIALVGWVFFVHGQFDVQQESVAATIITLLYEAVYVFTATVVTRQLLSPAGRPLALRIFEISLALLLLGVISYAILTTRGAYETGHPIDLLILGGGAGLAVAGLHGSMIDVTQVTHRQKLRLGPGRLAFYVVMLVALPVALILADEPLSTLELVALFVATAVVAVLVVARLASLVRDLERSERALAASEGQYRNLVEGMPGAVYLAEAGAGGRWLYASPQIEAITGYPPDRWISNPTTWIDSVDPLDRERVLVQEDRFVRGGDEFEADYRMRRRDGTVVWVRDRARSLPDRQHVLQGVLIDITEQMEAQEELSLVHERYAALIRNSSDVINIIDSEATIMFASDSVQQLTGYEPDEVVGVNAFELLHPEDHPEAKKALQALLDDPSSVAFVEGRTSMKGGGWIWVEINASNALADPAVRGIILNVRDVSRRKRDERLVEASEAHKTALLEAAPDGIVSMDHEGRIVGFNAAAERLFGRSYDAVFGKPAADILLPPELREIGMVGLDAYFGGEGSSVFGQRLELDLLRGETATFPAEITISKAESGGVPFFTAFVRDLTQQKLEEEERARLQANAERAQRLETVGQLAGGIAHDFNNMLSVIQNYAMFVEEALPAGDPAKEDCAEIISAARRASDMTRQLLVFSRRESTQAEILNVNDVISDMVEMLRRTVRENVDIHLDLASDLADVQADRSRIEQVLLNLVVNARDAMPEGGVLRIVTRNLPREPGPDPRPKAVSLSVSDSGVGIPDHLTDRIFEPFFTTKEKIGGTGLGLATVYGIARDAGGEVTVTSELGVGTTFEVWLPAHAGEPSPAAATPPADASPDERPCYRVLLVEDEPAVRRSVARMLERAGCTVIAPDSSFEAVSMYEAGDIHPDVLLTDAVMPGMSGREVAERLDLPTVFMSGYAREAGLDESVVLVQKPFDLSTLLDAVDQVVRAPRHPRVGDAPAPPRA